MLRVIVSLVGLCLGIWGGVRLLFVYLRWLSRRALQCSPNENVLAFFHPYCASGGGGERVLWVAVQALFALKSKYQHVVIYAGDEGQSKDDILKHVKNRFDIAFDKEQASHIHIVFIKSRTLLKAKWYPVGTMLFQSLFSMLVGLECILRLTPDVYCDTMGAAFTYPVVHYLCNAKVVAYVHYPIISTDMLKKVREQRPSYNNASTIASSVTISHFKLLYYQWFASAYSWVGRHAQVVMVNSSWTKHHVEQLWWYVSTSDNNNGDSDSGRSRGGSSDSSSYRSGNRRTLSLVYPPCNTKELLSMSASTHNKTTNNAATTTCTTTTTNNIASSIGNVNPGNKRIILSIAQFRPEKDHMLQIRSMKCLVDMAKGNELQDVEMVIMGSTRHADDIALLQTLQYTVTSLHLEQYVRFIPNAPYPVLQQYMQCSNIGIHTMWNEHFGISVVELMAAGLIVVAHNSGGPKMDIIPHISGDSSKANGYLAETPEEYASTMYDILTHPDSHISMRARARQSATRYSDEIFSEKFVRELNSVA